MIPPTFARSTAALVLAGLGMAPLQAQTLPDRVLCGAANVEDMVALSGTRWIIGSGIGDRHFQGGGLALIDAERPTIRRLAIDMPATAAAKVPYDHCPGPVPASAFSAHGLSLRALGSGRFRLFVVNHGLRESIEVFDLLAGRKGVRASWRGCVPAPSTSLPNAVAARPNGDLVMSSMASGDARVPSFHEQAQVGPSSITPPDEAQSERIARARGLVWTWSRAPGWQKVANSSLEGNNGIELSRDGRHAFVNSWPGESVTRIPLNAGTGEPNREIPIGFKPDNIRWSDDGRLVATGHLGSFREVLTCAFGNFADCAIDYRAAAIDPATLRATPLFTGKGTDRFGTATIGLLRQGTLWLGSVRSNCIATVKLPAK